MAMPSKPTDWAFLALRAKLATTSAISLSVIARVGSITRVLYSGVTVENRPGGPQIPDGRQDVASGKGPVPSTRKTPFSHNFGKIPNSEHRRLGKEWVRRVKK